MSESRPGSVLQVGSKVVLEYEGAQVSASVAEISDTNWKLEVKKEGRTTPFQEGSRIRLKYWDELGLYFVTAEVAADSGSQSSHLEVLVSGEPVALQRRGASRLSATLPFSFQVIEAESEALARDRQFKAETRDISGTGLSFDSVLPLKAMDELELVLEISPGRNVSVSATVVSSERVMRDSRPVNAIGMIFLDMSAETRQEIMQVLLHTDSAHVD